MVLGGVIHSLTDTVDALLGNGNGGSQHGNLGIDDLLNGAIGSVGPVLEGVLGQTALSLLDLNASLLSGDSLVMVDGKILKQSSNGSLLDVGIDIGDGSIAGSPLISVGGKIFAQGSNGSLIDLDLSIGSNGAIVGPGQPPGGQPNPSIPATNDDDYLIGTSTNDVIYGGTGNDTIEGGLGSDLINGNQGNDFVNGNQGSDYVRGGQGDDVVRGGRDDDQVFGDKENDFVAGDLGNDIVHGGQGNDEVRGGQGNDMVFGDLGDDQVWGDLGNDTMSGGGGADIFHFAANSGHDVILDFNRAEGDALNLYGQHYSASEVNGSTVLNLSGGGTIVLAGVDATSWDAGIFV